VSMPCTPSSSMVSSESWAWPRRYRSSTSSSASSMISRLAGISSMTRIIGASALVRKFQHHRSVVGGTLPGARRAIDRRGCQLRAQCLAGQDQVDAQAQVAAERALPVIPPTEMSRVFHERAKRIDEAKIEDAAQRRALGFRAQHLSAPRFRIVHVAIVGRDIEIAQHDHLAVALQFHAQVL